MFVNDLEQELISKDIAGLDLDYCKLFLRMYADDILLFSEIVECLPNRLNCMYEYCGKWNLSVNKQQTKFMLFRNGSILRRNTQFQYGKKQFRNSKSIHISWYHLYNWWCTPPSLTGTVWKAPEAIFILNTFVNPFTALP